MGCPPIPSSQHHLIPHQKLESGACPTLQVMTEIDFTDYASLPFPKDGCVVYVFCFKSEGSTAYTPFYVGESSRGVGRIGDYISAKFSASTDFKVGRTSQHLLELGCDVTVFYKAASDRKTEEKRLAKQLRISGVALLNDIPGYDYAVADEEEELARIIEFAKRLVLGPT